MTFKKFLKTCKKYKDFYIIEEIGNKLEIKRISKQHGKVTNGRILLFNEETEHISKHEIYVNRNGYFILWTRRRIMLEKFK